MGVNRRIYVSMPADPWLTDNENELKWGVVKRIEQLGYIPEIFTDPTGRNSMSAAQAWSASAAHEVAQHCQGAAIIGLPRWELRATDGPVFLPTEYCYYEGALARTLGLPLLVLAQQRLMRRVVFDMSFGPYVGVFPDDADKSWLDTPQFEVVFKTHWGSQLKARKDVFFGYCSQASATAGELRSFLESEVEATVLDWQRDFRPGRTILEEIEEARSRTSLGIFLFTKDDDLGLPGPGREAVPRDNVVFEAGYFAAAKGKGQVLVIREKGARMPADLGGDIYGSIEDRGDLGSVKQTIRQFVAGL